MHAMFIVKSVVHTVWYSVMSLFFSSSIASQAVFCCVSICTIKTDDLSSASQWHSKSQVVSCKTILGFILAHNQTSFLKHFKYLSKNNFTVTTVCTISKPSTGIYQILSPVLTDPTSNHFWQIWTNLVPAKFIYTFVLKLGRTKYKAKIWPDSAKQAIYSWK